VTGTAPTPAYDLDAWRRQIPLLETFIPMNHCSHSSQTVRTRAAAEAYLESWNRDGMDWDRWIGEVDAARAVFARLIGAEPEHVAVCPSVSAATSSLASALDFGAARRTVVASGAEFPTVGHVWLAQERRGARVKWVPVRDEIVYAEEYERAIDEDTLLVSATHGYYQNGFRQDVEAIARMAHARGALVFVDAYQTVGTCPIDVRALDVDFLAAGCLKYLMGVPGLAFLYVRPELLERMQPMVTGWFGRENPYAFQEAVLDWASGARRFDTGTPPIMEAFICRAGMEMIAEVGPENIGKWTEDLSRRLIEGGRRRGFRLHGTADAGRKTPSTAFVCPGDSHAVELRMRERGVLASARGPVIRLAPHFYSTAADVEAALDALDESLKA